MLKGVFDGMFGLKNNKVFFFFFYKLNNNKVDNVLLGLEVFQNKMSSQLLGCNNQDNLIYLLWLIKNRFNEYPKIFFKHLILKNYSLKKSSIIIFF